MTMQPLYLVIASASGLAVGYVAASAMASSARTALAAKLDDESSALKETQDKLKALKAAEAKGASKNKSAATAKNGGGKNAGKSKKKGADKAPQKDTKKLEKQIADAGREVERLKDAQMASEKAHADALAKVEAKLASADAEKSQAIEEAQADAAKVIETAKEEAAASKAAAESAAQDSVSAAQDSVSAAPPAVRPELTAAIEAAGTSLDGILNALLTVEGLTGLLLGDINGIVVAKAGDTDTVDNTAAASNTLISMPQKLDGMLALNRYFAFSLQDGENAIAGCTFESDGDVLALTSVGATAPSPESFQAAIVSISAALA